MIRPRTRVRILLLQALLLCALCSAHADLTSQIDDLVTVPELKYALIGVHIIDASSGDVLDSRNADVRMQPASNQKILKSAAAHDILGGDFVYHTGVLAGAEPGEDCVIDGPIYLRGSGDPTLTHTQVVALADAVHRAGVREVTGGIIADATAFADQSLGTGWSWDYLNSYYAAEVSALTVDGGCVKAIVRGAAKPGEPPVLRLEPFTEYLTLTSGAVTAKDVLKAPEIYRYLGRNVLALTGPIAVNQRVERRITVRELPLYCATIFKQALIKAGVQVPGGVTTGRTPPAAHTLCERQSSPLTELLARVNKSSDNNCAEAILRTISLAKNGVGTRQASVKLIDEWVESFGGDSIAFLMYDGSGLSRLNSVTPRLLVQVLRHMQNKADWVKTLPVMGQDGSLAGRLKDTPAEGKIRAKTGYVSGVRALSGYAQTNSGRRLIFSILVNNAFGSQAARSLQNKICLLLAAL